MERLVGIVVCKVTVAGLKWGVNFRVQQIDCCGLVPYDST
jgi:hypothetical protein